MNSKAKGKRVERLAAEALVKAGFLNAKRGWADGFDLMPASIPGIHIEVKGVERLNIWAAMDQAFQTACGIRGSYTNRSCSLVGDCGVANAIPVVLHKRNRSDWLLTLRLGDLPAFVEAVAAEWQRCEEADHEKS